MLYKSKNGAEVAKELAVLALKTAAVFAVSAFLFLWVISGPL